MPSLCALADDAREQLLSPAPPLSSHFDARGLAAKFKSKYYMATCVRSRARANDFICEHLLNGVAL